MPLCHVVFGQAHKLLLTGFINLHNVINTLFAVTTRREYFWKRSKKESSYTRQYNSLDEDCLHGRDYKMGIPIN